MIKTALAPIVAVVGSDGSGKSTVCAALLAWVQESRSAQICHLGKQTGNVGRSIARMPLMGTSLDRRISRKAGGAREAAGPDALTAIVIYLASMRRVRRFRRMLAVRRQGITVIADRYPQIVVPGPMDGPGLYAANPRSAVARVLAKREWAHYRWMASYRPDLVIRLTVDLETAVARKPDHRYSSLKLKVEHVPLLSFNGAPIVDIDSTLPLAEVLDRAKRAVATTLGLPYGDAS